MQAIRWCSKVFPGVWPATGYVNKTFFARGQTRQCGTTLWLLGDSPLTSGLRAEEAVECALPRPAIHKDMLTNWTLTLFREHPDGETRMELMPRVEQCTPWNTRLHYEAGDGSRILIVVNAWQRDARVIADIKGDVDIEAAGGFFRQWAGAYESKVLSAGLFSGHWTPDVEQRQDELPTYEQDRFLDNPAAGWKPPASLQDAIYFYETTGEAGPLMRRLDGIQRAPVTVGRVIQTTDRRLGGGPCWDPAENHRIASDLRLVSLDLMPDRDKVIEALSSSAWCYGTVAYAGIHVPCRHVLWLPNGEPNPPAYYNPFRPGVSFGDDAYDLQLGMPAELELWPSC